MSSALYHQEDLLSDSNQALDPHLYHISPIHVDVLTFDGHQGLSANQIDRFSIFSLLLVNTIHTSTRFTSIDRTDAKNVNSSIYSTSKTVPEKRQNSSITGIFIALPMARITISATNVAVIGTPTFSRATCHIWH